MELTVHEDEKTETQRAVTELGFEPKSRDSKFTCKATPYSTTPRISFFSLRRSMVSVENNPLSEISESLFQ